MANVSIRLATIDDAQDILDIYAPYITTPVTFEESIPNIEEFRLRTADVLAFYPYLVAEVDGTIKGYAYAHQLREREAYKWDAELSVYIAPDATRQGIGTKLYKTLLALISAQGIKAAYAVITAPNVASSHMHAALGFECQYVQKNAGYSCGAWRDMQWYVKYLGDFEDEPESPMPFPELQATRPLLIENILNEANE